MSSSSLLLILLLLLMERCFVVCELRPFFFLGILHIVCAPPHPPTHIHSSRLPCAVGGRRAAGAGLCGRGGADG